MGRTLIHIATVHYKNDRRLHVQLRYIRRCFAEPYRVYAILNKIEKKLGDLFYFSEDFNPLLSHSKTISQEHVKELNYLASKIVLEANNEDLLIFMDGDAFPISKKALPFLKEKIKNTAWSP